MTYRLEALVADTDGMDVVHAYSRLEAAGARVRVLETKDRDAIAAAGRTADVLLVSSAPVPAHLLKAMPRLKLVSCMSIGTDHVDVEAATSMGIRVSRLADVSVDSVAAHALTLALAAIRDLPECIEIAKSADWSIRRDIRPLDPSQLVLGVVGLGRIGRRFVEMASGVFSRVVGFDAIPAECDGVIQRCGPEMLARQCDVVSIHLPSTEETRAIVRERILPNLRRGSTLVNVSRGDLLPKEELLALLDSGGLRSVALDVLHPEPPAADDVLLTHPRVIVTPHYAFLSNRTAAEYPNLQVDAVLDFFQLPRI